ncbi:MAG TPA: hypothetical protein VIH12_03810 [Solibacillus sp.]
MKLTFETPRCEAPVASQRKAEGAVLTPKALEKFTKTLSKAVNDGTAT